MVNEVGRSHDDDEDALHNSVSSVQSPGASNFAASGSSKSPNGAKPVSSAPDLLQNNENDCAVQVAFFSLVRDSRPIIIEFNQRVQSCQQWAFA